MSQDDIRNSVSKCQEYRALKQFKKRSFQKSCISSIESTYNSDRTKMWKMISKLSSNTTSTITPNGDEFLNHYKSLGQPVPDPNFDYTYENDITILLKKYDFTVKEKKNVKTVQYDILNGNITIHELREIVNSLKNDKSPGIDGIPAEFVKCCDDIFLQELCNVYNYCIEHKEFPDMWAEGLRSSIYKAGDRLDPNNYRGLTVLPIFEKIFEITVQKRIEFINNAFEKNDKYNGGFLKGSRTSDNMFILQSLIERQVNLGKSLIVCFVDFTKAFDLINRNILFYKIIKSGLHGRVIDTLRNLYKKTTYRIKHEGKLSDPLRQTMGVNQGGNASPVIFREYLADVRDYLDDHTGVCLSDVTISDILILNLLWADDLIMVSTSETGTQSQLNGLETFSRKNQTTVNDVKTKVMVFGKPLKLSVTFQGKPMEQVNNYKYLGNIFRPLGDLYSKTYEYLCDKARKAVYNLLRTLRLMGQPSPEVMMYLFDSCIQPILVYGSDVWGVSNNGKESIDKIFMWFVKMVLNLKGTTSNVITLGECGKFPPSVTCEINSLSYFYRLRDLPDSSLAKISFNEQMRMHSIGFPTWYGRVCELASSHNIDINDNLSNLQIKRIIKDSFVQKWTRSLNDLTQNPILRTYSQIKVNFGMEVYLKKIKKKCPL